jgi:hypothetical protein
VTDQYNWATDVGGHVLDVANNASGRDFTLADNASANAQDMWNRYRGTFQPVENQVVQDATQYDSPEQMERVRQAAAGNANAAFDTAQASRAIDLARMGVNPNSGRFADPNAIVLSRTAGVADSMNRATAGRQDTAIALRQGVGQFGTGVAQLGDQAHQIALQATGAGTGAMNAAAGTASTIRTQPSAWAALAAQAYGTQFSNETGRFNAGTSRQSSDEATHHNFNVDAQNWSRIGMGAGGVSTGN